MEQYEDEEVGQDRASNNGRVLKFMARYWLRHPVLLTCTIGFTLLAIAFESSMPEIASRLMKTIEHGDPASTEIWWVWAAFIGIFVGGNLSRNVAFRFWNPLAARNMEEMTNEGFQKVQTFSADWHADTFAGSTVRRISRAMWGYDTVSDAVVLWMAPSIIVLLALSIQMLIKWPVVGAFSMVMAVLYLTSNVLFATYYVRPANLRSVAMDSRIGGALSDSVTSNPTVRGFGAEAREEARIGLVTSMWREKVLDTWNRYINVWLIHNLLLVMLQAGLTGLMIWQWTQGRAQAPDVVFVILAFQTIASQLRQMGDWIRMTQKGLADAEDVANYAEMEPQIADAPGAPAFQPADGEIVFDDVDFAYKSAENALYQDFSLRITRGERVALVGATGSGKTTFVKLLQRLYDVRKGQILIDGQDVASVTQGSLRRAIAVVPQDPALFHRTIAENIGYSRPGATHAEIELAARRARAHEFISRLPKGYDTLVGERGVKLSGGERQRVAIARAFLADAPILVLDEATSSLDVETERDVQAATEELMKGRTTVVIAHRLSTIRGADRILVFQDGKVIEEGRHGELVDLGGTYARLHAVTMSGA
ncbi:MAG: ABC transporter ATP-binding protein [Caulobacteraceae bacterium]